MSYFQMSTRIIRTIFVLIFVFSIIIEAKNTCDSCVSLLPAEDVLIREGQYYYNDLESLEATLFDLCETLEDDDFPLMKCYNQVVSYLTPLREQPSCHEISFSSVQLCARISACLVGCCESKLGEQVHLSLTGDPTEMVVMWVSAEYYENATVRYFQPGFNSNNKMLATAVQSTYTDGGWIGNIYTAVMTSLQPSSEYYYELSEGAVYSRSYQFYSAPPLNTASFKPHYVRRDLTLIADYEKFNAPVFEQRKRNIDAVASPVIALYGDMDTLSNSNQTATSLATLASNYSINLVIHNGDISYADQDEQIWDTFFRMVQGYTSFVPFMTSPGNHESFYNFTAYYARLTNPVTQSHSPSKQYYSFNYQNIHFVSWSFEEYKGLDLLPGEPQYEWLVNDLTEANNNRDLQPWIVLFGHRPLYCSTTGSNCKQAYYMRYLLEDLINEYHVDVVIQAHDHNYERSYPVYKNQTLTTSYNDPPAPVYFVVGTGGVDKNSKWAVPPPLYNAAEVDKYGYLLMSAPDAHTLDLTFISKSFNVYDNCTITRSTSFW